MSWSADIYSAAARLICIKGEIEKWRERDRVGEGRLQLKRTPHEQEPEICIDQTDNLIRATGKRKKSPEFYLFMLQIDSILRRDLSSQAE